MYFAFYAVVTPVTYEELSPEEPIGYSLRVGKKEYVGQPHLVTVSLWSNRKLRIIDASIRYMMPGEDVPRSAKLYQVGSGRFWAGELPPAGLGERVLWYVEAIDEAGASVNIPRQAPQPPLFYTRWERKVNPYLLALHISLMIGTLFFFIHALYYGLLILFGKMGDLAQNATANKAHQALRWGWLAFFLGGILVGGFVSASALGANNFFSGWPFGSDITDTKTEFLLVYFGIVILLRADLFRFTPSVKRTGRITNRAFSWLIVLGSILTALVYAIPHSYFFQSGK